MAGTENRYFIDVVLWRRFARSLALISRFLVLISETLNSIATTRVSERDGSGDNKRYLHPTTPTVWSTLSVPSQSLRKKLAFFAKSCRLFMING